MTFDQTRGYLQVRIFLVWFWKFSCNNDSMSWYIVLINYFSFHAGDFTRKLNFLACIAYYGYVKEFVAADMATELRRLIIKMLTIAGSGHAAGAMGMADVFAVLYGQVLRHRPTEPGWLNRDRVIVSNGHICPVLYAALAHSGYFEEAELGALRQINGVLQGHPERKVQWGIENTSGPLGQGLSVAAGQAWAVRHLRLQSHVYAVLSDGEHQEGQAWEAYLWAAKERLGNLTAIIDRNFIQISGVTEQIMPLEPLKEKIRAFGWAVSEVNGHDHEAIKKSLLQRDSNGRPQAVICLTEPGRGVSFIESRSAWHGLAPNLREAQKALKELNSLTGRLETQYD